MAPRTRTYTPMCTLEYVPVVQQEHRCWNRCTFNGKITVPLTRQISAVCREPRVLVVREPDAWEGRVTGPL